MRAAFVNNLYGSYGADPLHSEAFIDKVEKYGLRGLCFPADDENLTAGDLDLLRTPRAQGGIFTDGVSVWTLRDPNWTRSGPVDLVHRLVCDVTRFAPDSAQLTLCIDYEGQDPNYMIAALIYAREQPQLDARRLVWSPQGHQGGWFTPDLVGVIGSTPLNIVAPEQYMDATHDWGTVSQVRGDLISRLINPAQVKVFVRGGELTPDTFPDGIAWALDLGSPWGLP